MRDDSTSSSRDGAGGIGGSALPSRAGPPVVRLGILFGSLYFIQGLIEPSTGMIYQPTLGALTVLGLTTTGQGEFMAHIGWPWTFKPLYGLISDFLPIAGYRRRSWLLVSAGVTSAGYLALAGVPEWRASYGGLLGCLLAVNLAVAFTDVVVDATMVERGQPLGITGRLQGIQWGCMYGAMALAGWAGGELAERDLLDVGFLCCGLVACGTIGLTLWGVDERRHAIPSQDLGSALRSFGRAFRSRTILLGGAFLLLLNFNPFSAEVLNEYQLHELGMTESEIGRRSMFAALAQMAASFLYAGYCTRVRFAWLVHGSVVLGIVSTLGYWALEGPRSAMAIAIVLGFAYQTASMIQFDLAARVCPPQIAGTMFALLMSLSNTGITASSYFGGRWYEALKAHYGPTGAFQYLVGIGAAFTASAWLLVPWLLKHDHQHETETTDARE